MAFGSITGNLINPALLDPVFSPLMSLPGWAAIGVIALIVSVIVTLVYKFATDQDLMKELKGEMKELQAEMKELKDHPEKMMDVQSKFMKTNMKYMTHSMRSTLFTILPIIFIFGWLNANLAYLPLQPGIPFEVTAQFDRGTTGIAHLSVITGSALEVQVDPTQEIVEGIAKWTLKGQDGEYTVEILPPEGESKSQQAELLITQANSYKQPVTKVKGSSIKTITIGNEKLHPLGETRVLGWQPGWLGMYILFSLVFSMALRKVLKLA